MSRSSSDAARMPRIRRAQGAGVLMLALAVLCAVLAASAARGAPSGPTDESKVPHYFGPYPNWANSPLTAPDAKVTINGDGTGATAEATVGAKGAITGLTITNPGSGYTSATVAIGGAGSGATADAAVQTSGSVTSVSVDNGGAGYVKPAVKISGGGATTDATAHALGGVDAVTLGASGYPGYTFPTVGFDLPDDPDGIQARGHATCLETDCKPATPGGTVTVTGVVVDEPGSGYTSAPGVAILDGTQFDPVTHDPGTFTPAEASATLKIASVAVDTFGAGYTSAPAVEITDPSGVGASATASTDAGAVTKLTLTDSGSGYVTPGGIKKFQDGLPGLGEAGKNNLGQYIPVAKPDTTTFANADYYVIALVQHRERMSSSLPAKGTLLREYVQLSTDAVPGKHVPLKNDLLDGTSVDVKMPDGSPAYGVDDPHALGPFVSATKDRPVRVVFYNLLPAGAGGDLFLPTDSSMMGSGMGPMDMAAPKDQGSVMDEVRNPACTEYPKGADCFKDNRATLHLHGGVTPWISDGTPHQWITPASENTPWPRGVSVQNVPDMVGTTRPANVPDCSAARSGCETFYYTNQQSARMMFYHDHSWGITRLNVYAGEAAGYAITDPSEKKLIDSGTIPGAADTLPLIVQDRTFVPGADQLKQQDPTWDASRWGDAGNLWYHHVYMPAQNPGDPSGMSAFGRWMYGPWFWPPAKPQHGPIDNPYHDAACKLDDPKTWQYQTAPYCEPEQIPGTPNISAGMEQFNDTPVVNGTAYPTTTVEPKAYRMRILNAANDRFWNLQWYVADPTTGTDSEVALKASELAAAQTDPNVVPTPDTSVSPAGPDWIQIGSEGGFLPAPTVVKNQPITWITDPTRFDVGNVDKHALLLAPAERADTVVDFSKYAGKTLILYNDAPAAFPARIACYDYYTGGPDLTPACAPTTLPGYGPNTRTVMQIKVAANSPAPAFDLPKLQAAFRHHADGSGVFESGQPPAIVGQAAYNSAYGKSFAKSGFCSSPSSTVACDGFARISQQGGDPFTFDTLNGGKLSVPLQPKAIHDEMNAASFDEFGRMTANLGVEAVPATPAGQNVTLYPYINPQTELIDASGLPAGDVTVKPISTADDGTQIWKITHNGVDTHPLHFHLYDVQVINRVTWDNIIIPPDDSELGWKDTVRISPLEDTIVALRPVIPKLPFEIPNSIRPLNPMMPAGDTSGFNSVDPSGNPTAPVTNRLVNFGWEYVFHCHILSHEEMDMMRPVSVALPPNKASGLASTVSGNGTNRRLTLSWSDNSITETSFLVQKSLDGTTWADVGTVDSPLDQPNGHGPRSLRDPATYDPNVPVRYRVVARNTVGYGAEFPSMTVRSISDALVIGAAPAAPTGLTAALQSGPRVSLSWTDRATNESGFVVERSVDGGAFAQIAAPAARSGTGTVTYVDPTVTPGATYAYRVAAVNAVDRSAYSNTATVTIAALPAAPAIKTATAARSGSNERVTVTWGAVPGATGYRIQWSATPAFTTVAGSGTVGAVTSFTTGNIARQAWSFRVIATNAAGDSPASGVVTVAAAP
jgi:FtsP/CotA-like multicopper oxidase with cupredoxin domain